jgi:hypothetical protein
MQEDIIEWIQEFLRGEGNNIGLADGLLLKKRYYFGPVTYDINKLQRSCGPETSMKYRTSEDEFNKKVNNIINRIESGWEMPPLIVNYENNKMIINDGNHRHEAYKRMGKYYVQVIFWVTKEKEYDKFLKMNEFMEKK